MHKPQNILICPLNWGLGHATRCVPLIKELSSQGHQVILAADGQAHDYLQQSFPELTIERLPDVQMHYMRPWFKASWAIALQGFKILRNKKREHALVKGLVQKHAIHWIISDNRYGVYHAKTKNTLITHQLFPISPWFQPLIHKIIKKWINAFDECWVPDYEQEHKSLSGKLSHGDLREFKKIQYIDPLSRFKGMQADSKEIKYEYLVILSGLEPHRTAFEKKMIQQLSVKSGRHALVLGKSSSNTFWQEGNLDFYAFADTVKLFELIRQSKHVIARSGYSTIMDLHVLGKEATLIPTPGQTEQEYLADWLKQDPVFLKEL